VTDSFGKVIFSDGRAWHKRGRSQRDPMVSKAE
jgi:hypothetical protein